MEFIDCIDRRSAFVVAYERDGTGAGAGADGPACTTARPSAAQAAPAGPVVVPVRKNRYASHRPAGADSIAGTAPPAIALAGEPEETGPSGWITSIAGDIPGLARLPVARPAAVS